MNYNRLPTEPAEIQGRRATANADKVYRIRARAQGALFGKLVSIHTEAAKQTKLLQSDNLRRAALDNELARVNERIAVAHEKQVEQLSSIADTLGQLLICYHTRTA